MSYTAGLDVGSTYTKAVILDDRDQIAGRSMINTGFKLDQAAQRAFDQAMKAAGLTGDQVGYVVGTGYGRYQVPFRDANATDLTSAAHGSRFFFPGTHTVLDIGGQTMKASRLGDTTTRGTTPGNAAPG